MKLNFIFEAVLLLLTSVILVRFAGKKSIARMTALETVIILAIASTMGHAIKENTFWQVILILVVYVAFLIIVQRLELKSYIIKKLLIGHATLVIRDGEVLNENLKKLRLTKDQLDMRLRQKGISYITDVKTGTIELDGDLGFELMPHAKPITKEELEKLLNKKDSEEPTGSKGENIFELVVQKNKKKE